MPTANEQLVDHAIRHQVELAQYSNSVVRRIMAVMNRTDARMSEELASVVQRIANEPTFRVERLEAMLASIRALNAQAYAQVGQELRAELENFVAYEANWQRMNLVDVLPAQVSVASVSVQQVYAATMSRPFQGVLLNTALAEVEATTAKRIRQTISQGIIEGRTTDQIVRDIRGSKALCYNDGLMNRSRREVEAITRTAISHVAGMVQDASVEANKDIIKGVEWVSTLDLRTSEQCRLRDNLLYAPVTHKPIGHSYPWLAGPGRLHWNCRSSQITVLKSWREMGIDIEGGANARDTRASLDGQVASNKSYATWLSQQSAARQDEVLGVQRGKLMRQGGLSLEQMYDQRGRYLTLEELRQRDAKAFRKAGL